MESALGWLGQIFGAILKFFPRIIVIRATHGGVKWKYGKYIRAMGPGVHVYLPLITEIDVLPTARQTSDIPIQHLTSKDNKRIAIGVVVVYRINDVILAFGEKNWDVDTTVKDITQTAVVSIIASHAFDVLLTKIGNDMLNSLLTEATKKELSRFGVVVQQCKLTDFAECRVLKIMLDSSCVPKTQEE